MRVIAGKAKGGAIRVPREVARPTTDRVRESLFGILGELVVGVRVLDLFAGSGGLGLEALSRGAAGCVFVEQNRGAARVIEENLKRLRLEGGRVVVSEVGKFLRGMKESFEIILADPPYADGLRDAARDLAGLTGWREWLAEDGYLVIESEAMGAGLVVESMELVTQRDYGRSRISIFRRGGSE